MSILYYIVNHTKKLYYDTYHKHPSCLGEDEPLMVDLMIKMGGMWKGDHITVEMEWFIDEKEEYKPIKIHSY